MASFGIGHSLIVRHRLRLHPTGDRALLADVVGRCCEIKAEVVAADECEGGLRAILNLDIRWVIRLRIDLGMGGRIFMVKRSVGMVYAARLSVVVCVMASEEADQLSIIGKVGIAGACIRVEVGFFTRSDGC